MRLLRFTLFRLDVKSKHLGLGLDHVYLTRMWNGVVPDRCRQLYRKGEEWQCFFGHKLYATLTCELHYKNMRDMRERVRSYHSLWFNSAV